MATSDLTAERLREMLQYDPDTGVFTWIVGSIRNPAGSTAGTTRSTYQTISIQYVRHFAHRLAWLHYYGEWPKGNLDHIDHDTRNNRIHNLRDVSQAGNMQNQIRAMSHNLSGLLGVSKRVRGKRGTVTYYARIKVGKKVRHLGCFACPHEAHAAYVEAKRRLHETCTI